MTNEIWKDIEGFEGKYQISSHGRIKTISRKVKFGKINRIIKEQLLKPCSNGNGYLYVSLGRCNNNYIHRLVATHFIPNPNNLPQVNHKDENPCNNCADNLEWCDAKYNCNYGNHSKKRCKSVLQFSKDGKYLKTWNSIKDAEISIGKTHIWDCCIGKRNTCGGYIWKYNNELDKLFEDVN